LIDLKRGTWNDWGWNEAKNRLFIVDGIKTAWMSNSCEKTNSLRGNEATMDSRYCHGPSMVSSGSTFSGSFFLFHGHSNLGASLESQNTLNQGQNKGKKVSNPTKYRKEPYPSIKRKKECII